jgi:hypothetical protein
MENTNLFLESDPDNSKRMIVHRVGSVESAHLEQQLVAWRRAARAKAQNRKGSVKS